MKSESHTGVFYDFGSDVSSWEEFASDYALTAIIRPNELVLEWEEGGKRLMAKLISQDGYEYRGDITHPEVRGVAGEMKGFLYKSTSGEYTLWLEMYYVTNGYGGHYIVHLTPRL